MLDRAHDARRIRTMKTDFRYRAFLSYSHVDAQWARWLHRRLEGFRLRELAGRDGLRGPVPPSLAPIFRDREEFDRLMKERGGTFDNNGQPI